MAPQEMTDAFRRSPDESGYIFAAHEKSLLIVARGSCASSAATEKMFEGSGLRAFRCSLVGAAIEPETKALITPIDAETKAIGVSIEGALQSVRDKFALDEKTRSEIKRALAP